MMMENNGEVGSKLFPNKNKANIKNLNHDCLVQIFQYLPICDRISLEKVSKQWCAASLASWYNVKRLDFSERLWGQEWDQAKDFPLEEVLSRCGEFITHAKLKPFFGSNIRPLSTIWVIARMCPNLRSLNLVGIKVCANQLKFLVNHCRQVTELYLGETTSGCGDALLENVVFDQYRELRVLEINSNDYVTGSCLKKLSGESIRKLSLSYCFRLRFSVVLDVLKSFDNLHTLVLKQTLSLRKSDYLLFFEFIGSLKLKELDLSFNDTVVDDHFLIKLANVCNNLNYLNISGNYYVTDIGLGAVTMMSSLEHLVINWLRKVSGLVIMNLPKLKILSCCGCYRMEDEGLVKILHTSRRIRLINIIYCKKVSDDFIFTAAKVTQTRGNEIQLMIMTTDPDRYEDFADTPLLKLI